MPAVFMPDFLPTPAGITYISNGHIIVIYHTEDEKRWRYSIDNKFCSKIFPTKEAAKLDAFEAIEKILGHPGVLK